MAVSIDNSAKGHSTADTNNVSTSSFAIDGSNRVLYALVLSGDGSPVNPTAVKWGGSGGASLTQLGSVLDITGFVKISLWRLIAPAVQTSTVYVEWGANQGEKAVIAVSVKDADQATPNGTVATATGTTSTTVTVNATGSAGQLVLDFAAFADGGGAGTFTPGAGQTSLQEIEGADLTYQGLGSSWETAAGASTTMSWTLNAGRDGWGIFAFALNEAAAGPADEYPVAPKPPDFYKTVLTM